MHLLMQTLNNTHFLLCVPRWPRLPVQSSSSLDFGATPVNESKVSTLVGFRIVALCILLSFMIQYLKNGVFTTEALCIQLSFMIFEVWKYFSESFITSSAWVYLLASFTDSMSFSISQVKSLTLKNPSGSVVSVEIRALSSYPAPLEALDLLTKWYCSHQWICTYCGEALTALVYCMPFFAAYYVYDHLIHSVGHQVQHQPPVCEHLHHRVLHPARRL